MKRERGRERREARGLLGGPTWLATAGRAGPPPCDSRWFGGRRESARRGEEARGQDKEQGFGAGTEEQHKQTQRHRDGQTEEKETKSKLTRAGEAQNEG